MSNTIDQKAKAIKLFITDVDGVLTSGHLVFGNQGLMCKEFHVHDGLGLQMLKRSGIKIAAITTCVAELNRVRLEFLAFDDILLGQKDKRAAYQQLLSKYQLTDENVAYIGDDLPDLALIKRAGLGIVPANANTTMIAHADWQTTHSGGHGAIREVCERIMQAQGTFDAQILPYLS